MYNILQKKNLLTLTECMVWDEVTEGVLQQRQGPDMPEKRNKKCKGPEEWHSPLFFRNSKVMKIVSV